MLLSLLLISKAPITITVTWRLVLDQKSVVLGTAQREQNPTARGPLLPSLLCRDGVLEQGQGLLGSCEGHKVLTIEFNRGNTAPTCQTGTRSKGAEKDLASGSRSPSPDSSRRIPGTPARVAAPEQMPPARTLTWPSWKTAFSIVCYERNLKL